MTEHASRETLRDHALHPRNVGVFLDADVSAHAWNASCGDIVDVSAKLDDHDRVLGMRFLSCGCAVSQASASLLSEAVVGMTASEVLALSPAAGMALLGVLVGPMRVRCATLALVALQKGIRERL